MKIGEVLGYGIETQTAAVDASRKALLCPFRQTRCTKSSISDPIGVCSLRSGTEAAALCPVRFVENNRIFSDAATLAFGTGTTFAVFPEIRVLTIPGTKGDENQKKIGKVDYLIGRLSEETVVDFAAIEVQAAYFSGNSIRPALTAFLAGDTQPLNDLDRRPDFRSSAQKRLMPQLQLKVPIFRRWGKKFFVVSDTLFFKSLPKFPVVSQANSELTWLTYPIAASGTNFKMQNPIIVHSAWDDVNNALREGKPPEPAEILAELQTKLHKSKSMIRRLRT